MATSMTDYKRGEPGDARQVRSRKALTGALFDLLQEKGFDQITIREITARAGTGYATFFRHYPDKEALLADIAAEAIAGLLKLTTPILYAEDSHRSTQALCRQVWKHRKLWTGLLTGGAASIVRTEFIRQARQLPRDSDTVAGWLPADLGVVHGTAATFDLLAWWLSQDTVYSPEQIGEILNRLVISPLVGPRARIASTGT